MVFSAPAFLFFFLPIFLLITFCLRQELRNLFIFLASILFYFVDGGSLTLVLVASIALNYFIAIGIQRLDKINRVLLFIFGILVNLVPLLYYKYSVFFISVLHDVVPSFHAGGLKAGAIALPVGISFFTFHSLSYLIDVYQGKVAPEKSLVDFGMYMANFPQLIAGPIVRYSEVKDDIRHRPLTVDNIYAGMVRFVIGLGKKAILADNIGFVADKAFSLPPGGLTTAMAWLGILAYTLQIFFDFSGYSDMAIGIGRMMGFRFPENFNQPYCARNITEFWRRWHMTLSRWFRDYVYIPLGGNRKGSLRTFFNLLAVFFLCGLWHGAAYGFVIWGFYHGLLLVFERILKNTIKFEPSGIAGQLATFFLVMLGWVFFRAANLKAAAFFFSALAFHPVLDPDLIHYKVSLDKLFFIGLGMFFAFMRPEWISAVNISGRVPAKLAVVMQGVCSMVILVISCAMISTNGFNPFIYFRF